MNLRTDLAVERREIVGSDYIDGVILKEYEEKGVKVTEIRVTDERGSKALGKPPGEYITLEVTPFTRMTDLFSSQLEVISNHIERLLPDEGTVLVIGLGKPDETVVVVGVENGNVKYYRDSKNRHFVPKRDISELIL